jgi:hypothetical protein
MSTLVRGIILSSALEEAQQVLDSAKNRTVVVAGGLGLGLGLGLHDWHTSPTLETRQATQ